MSDTEQKKKVSPEFIQSVKKYLETDDKLRGFKEETKKLNKEKKSQEEFILSYLERIEENILDVPNGKLRRNISKTQAPLKKETICKALTEVVGDAIKANTLTEHIIKSRPIVERVTLKRTRNRGGNDE
jgi:serine phosphatase RsbU (regulator of sigma subunit)